uniref:Uncharacterized protein n=1 Tax=uncultured marine virus TaxID=186617 RepID=A0A0F7L499_9VIRU|nr:hypothetical protein [uncultured marine virus]
MADSPTRLAGLRKHGCKHHRDWTDFGEGARRAAMGLSYLVRFWLGTEQVSV